MKPQDTVQDIPVDKVEPNPAQPRKVFPADHIAQLAKSIKKRGLRQPITVRHIPETDRYMIVMGECRWKAHVLNAAPTIRCIVEDMTDREVRINAIIENLQRRDMNPIEEANAYKSLIDIDGYSTGQVMEELGLKSTAIVTQRLALLNLSPDIQGLVATGNLAVNMAWGVAQAPAHLQMRLLRDIQAGRFRTSEQVKHAGIAMREAASQNAMFDAASTISKNDLAALTRLENKINEMASTVSLGFKNGECVAAKRVSADRVFKMADKLALIRKHILQMEHNLRCVATQTEIKLEVAA